MPLDLSNQDTCPECHSFDIDEPRKCSKCGDSITICKDCNTITEECRCGHCEGGTKFEEPGKPKSLPLLPAESIILTKADTDLCLGSQELKSCPFCGSDAMSSGQKTSNGKAIKWTIQCMGHDPVHCLVPNCFAQVTGTDPDQDTARAMAVARWNRRAT